MFNRSAFGQSAFNCPFTIISIISIASVLRGDGRMTVLTSVDAMVTTTINGNSGLTAAYMRDITGTPITLAAIAKLAMDYARWIEYTAHLSGNAELRVFVRHTHADIFAIDAPIAPGERVVLDADRNLAIKSGIPIGHTGNIPYLHPGENIVSYKDVVSGRNILIRITYRDRYL